MNKDRKLDIACVLITAVMILFIGGLYYAINN